MKVFLWRDVLEGGEYLGIMLAVAETVGQAREMLRARVYAEQSADPPADLSERHRQWTIDYRKRMRDQFDADIAREPEIHELPFAWHEWGAG